jgi:hypothetical protein
MLKRFVWAAFDNRESGLRGREWHVVGHYRLGQPFERKLADFFERCCRFHTAEDLPVLSLGAEPGSELHTVPIAVYPERSAKPIWPNAA